MTYKEKIEQLYTDRNNSRVLHKTLDYKRQAVDLFLQGKKAYEVAEEMGCSKVSVYAYIKLAREGKLD